MRRYQGEALAARPRLAVIANDALGNFVVVTPLLTALRSRHDPVCLDFYGGIRTQELQDASPLIDYSYPLHNSEPQAAEVAAATRLSLGEYDLVVNVESGDQAKSFAGRLAEEDCFVVGPCRGQDGDLPFADDAVGRLATDPFWTAADLTTRYPMLETGFIGEIFCRLAYLKGTIPPYDVPLADPGRPIPDVLIATAASLPDKLWPAEKWIDVLELLNHSGVSAGLLGAKPENQRRFWKGDDAEETILESGFVQDLRGEFTLPQVVGALARAKRVLTIDNGILHLAVAARTPVVGLFRFGIHRLWAPPFPNLTVLTPDEGRPVSSIDVGTVWEAIRDR